MRNGDGNLEPADAAHAAKRGRIVAEHVEVESGRRKDRPQLTAALAACRALPPGTPTPIGAAAVAPAAPAPAPTK